MIRTRYAPSPTGYLHVGGLRTALYCYLFAKKNNGEFLLRIEDTDRERFVADGTKNILDSLTWAGIIPEKEPYIQSEHVEVYQKYADELMERGQAYYCFCTAERLSELREKQQKNKLPTGYDGHCQKIDPTEAKKRVAAGEKHVIRMKMPKSGETVFTDLIRGEIKVKNALVDDQVIIKSDGFPTYHLAVVVDDHLMEISHVIRGEEWISSTPKHLQLHKYFGWEPPQFAHLPLLLNADKSKLSKRQGDVAVSDYIAKGYLPEAMINFVAFLGWNPGDNREMFSLSDLVKEFSFEKVNKSGAVFNLEKLDWFNKEYIKLKSVDELAELSLPFFKNKITKEQLVKILPLEKDRVVTLAELPEALGFVFELPDYDGELLVWKKSNHDEAKEILLKLNDLMNTKSVQGWNRAELEAKVGEWIKTNELSNGVVLWPLRVAVSGQEKSPGPFEIMEALGPEETKKRLAVALKKIS